MCEPASLFTCAASIRITTDVRAGADRQRRSQIVSFVHRIVCVLNQGIPGILSKTNPIQDSIFLKYARSKFKAA